MSAGAANAHLPEGEIPGHDGEHRPERHSATKLLDAPADILVAEVRRCILRVVPADARALGGFAPRGPEGLPHLLHREPRKRLAPGVEEIGRAAHRRRARGDVRAAVLLEGGRGARDAGPRPRPRHAA